MLDVRNHKLRARVGRMVAAGVAVATLFGGVGVAQAAQFRDVTATTPHRDDIIWLADKGIAQGYDNGTFGGMRSVVRQDMAAFLYKMAGSPSFDADKALAGKPFKDVTRSTPHWQAILWANSVGVMQGYPDGSFGGMRTVVRQDMAAFLHRYADWLGVQPTLGEAKAFRDVTPGTPHRDDIVWLSRTAVAAGFEDGTFGGMRSVVRQDMAAFLHRLAVKPTQAQLDAARKAVADARSRVDAARAGVDAAKPDADRAQAQYDAGSPAFYKAMGWRQALDIFDYEDDIFGSGKIKDSSWFRKDPSTSATSLDNMRWGVTFMEQINQYRRSLGRGELLVTPRQEAWAQAQEDWQKANGMQHAYYDDEQALVYGLGKDMLTGLMAEKPAFDKLYAQHPDVWDAYNNGVCTEASCSGGSWVLADKYGVDPDSVGHYMSLVNPAGKYMGVAADYRNNAAGLVLNVNSEESFFLATGPMVTYEDIMPVSEYKTKLNDYITGLNNRIKPYKDAQAKLTDAQNALKQAQAKLDALTKA